MKSNTLYLVIGALLVLVVGLGIYVLQEEAEPEGIEMRIDESGLSIEEN